MTDKKYTIRPKGKTEPVFEVTDFEPGDGYAFSARLAESVGRNAFHKGEWDIEEIQPTTLDLLNDCGENAYVTSRTDANSFGFAKEEGNWWRIGDVGIVYHVEEVAREIDRCGLEIIFEGVK